MHADAEDPATCKIYFFDDGAPGWPGCRKDPATHRKWNRWDLANSRWEPLEGLPPPPSGIYAGIGATILSKEYGEAAIKAVMRA